MQSERTRIATELIQNFHALTPQSGELKDILFLQVGQRFLAMITETVIANNEEQAGILNAKREAIRRCSLVHLEEYSESMSRISLTYSMVLSARCAQSAQEEVDCTLLLLESEAQRLKTCFDLSA